MKDTLAGLDRIRARVRDADAALARTESYLNDAAKELARIVAALDELGADVEALRAEVGEHIAQRLERYAAEVEPDGLEDEAKDARMFASFIREEKWWE